jgi:hypothetical protein
MNNMKKLFVTLIIIASYYSCGGDLLEYKYQDKELNMNCKQIDIPLMKEALYSFEDDIASFYNNENYSPGTRIYYHFGYANFIYTGATGEADFQNIVSTHSLSILSKLRKEPELYIEKKDASNLNYQHEFVQCLINQIKNAEIKDKIKTLLSVDFLTPKNMAEFYRVNIEDAKTDKHFALFIALDTYYQYLIDLEESNLKTNG